MAEPLSDPDVEDDSDEVGASVVAPLSAVTDAAPGASQTGTARAAANATAMVKSCRLTMNTFFGRRLNQSHCFYYSDWEK
ncbi:hypothetical protein [Micromonospora sp. NPDC093277]|uniref:hypothetical protein n=1 Tax=Micromonospora sp. NPDC093277 TaxID=3364291 RepID=UPI00380D3932